MSGGQRLDVPAPLPFEEAARLAREAVQPLEIVSCPIADADGRFLAEDVVAPHDVPPFANSMVDGFAVRSADVASASAESPVELRVLADVPAGDASDAAVEAGGAIRIMTGAPVPPGADAVVMLEWTEWTEDRVRVARAVRPGQFVRAAGEDMQAGDRVLQAGERLDAPRLGVAASLGAAELRVRRAPRVAVLATGDELLEVHEPLRPGHIRSSNTYTIAGQVREAGGLPTDLGIARDDDADLARRLAAAHEADVLVTSGGVSVGDRDRVQAVLVRSGFERIFWRVLSSPGKPLLFGRLGRRLVFGLPGNPVSSMVAFENFVRPALLRLQGAAAPERPRVRARVVGELRGPEDRRHFARVEVRGSETGLTVREVGPHGSGNLRSMVHAGGLAIVPEGVGHLAEGDPVEVLLLAPPKE